MHRDLEPANIFLVDDPAVPGGARTKLLDFGIAKLVEDDTAAVRTWRRDALHGDVVASSAAWSAW